MRKLIIPGLMLGLAACQPDSAPSGDPVGGNEAAAESQANVIDQLEALPEGQRNAVFIRALQDAAQPCQHVESSQRSGEYRGLPVWTARCTGGTDWTIVVNADGTAAVLNPAEAELARDPAAPGNAQ